jgi:CRAL/TRIO domain
MGQLVIINVPTSFTAIWTVIKQWLSPRTLDKISILGANQHQAALLDLIPPENLPASLGGTCTCDDTHSGGCALSNAGPWMDDGRAERRARWLSGELAVPGMLWPPTRQQQQKSELKHDREDHDEDDEDDDDDDDVAAFLAAAEEAQWEEVEQVHSCHVVAANATATSPASSWGRASVVALPLPLPSHPPAPAAVRLVA